MLLTNVCRATVPRNALLAYTTAEAASVVAVNSAYAPTLAVLPSSSPFSSLQYPTTVSHHALAIYYAPPDSSELGITVATAGMPPVSGVRPRMMPNPATSRIEVLPFSDNDVKICKATVDTVVDISPQRPIVGAPSLLNGVYNIFSRAATFVSSPPGVIVAVAPLSSSATATTLANRRVDEQPAPARPASVSPVDNVAALHAFDLTPRVFPPADGSISDRLQNLEMLESPPSSLRMSATESCTPLWRTLFLDERDSDLNFIARNGGAYA